MENETGNRCLCGEPFERYEIGLGNVLCERCLWRKAENTTRAGMLESVEIAAREIVTYLTDENGEIDTTNLDDALTENADNLIPIYYGRQFREWYAIDMPEFEQTNYVGSEFMASALFEWYYEQLSETVNTLIAAAE